jgi:aspartyl/asparaginyl beta-hydroxylase (cupin superfamily)
MGNLTPPAAEQARAQFAAGQSAFANGDFAAAREAYQRVVALDGSIPQHWSFLALACRSLQDEAAEEEAVGRALAIDPRELLALILRASLHERRGQKHKAALAYGAVVTVAPPPERLHPDLREWVVYAWNFREAYDRELAGFLDQRLEADLRALEGQDLRRFRDSVDIMVGRKRRYDSQAEIYHYPHLAPIEFFDRERFAWLDAIEAATDAIRDEFLAVLESDEGFTPYITYPEGVPLNQWVELNNSPRWSAFHLYKMGALVAENAAKCPRTMEALAHAPQPDQPGRTPAAMFSLLKPKTHIPPHTGVTNARLVTHLPLIVPEGCRFRVGNETREWIPGKALVFDDTIEHEAWNDSDKLRVVLIFDIWHPDLSPGERSMVTAMTRALRDFTGEAAGGEL